MVTPLTTLPHYETHVKAGWGLKASSGGGRRRGVRGDKIGVGQGKGRGVSLLPSVTSFFTWSANSHLEKGNTDAPHVLNSLQLGTEVALLQGFWHVLLFLHVFLTPYVSCPWQREQISNRK